MELEAFQKKIAVEFDRIDVLQTVAKEIEAEREVRKILYIREMMEERSFALLEEDSEQEEKLSKLLEEIERQLHHVAGRLILDGIEPRLITAVMNGENMHDNLKLLTPKFVNAQKRLAEQQKSRRHKLERMAVKYVMHYEANYYIMLRKLSEDVQGYTGVIDADTLQQALLSIIEREQHWCVRQMLEDITEMETAILEFATDIQQQMYKCRQEAITIMHDPFITMVAQKTESALELLDYADVPASIYALRENLHFYEQGLGMEAGLDYQIAESIRSWKNQLSPSEEPDVGKLLRQVSQNVQHVFKQLEGRAKKTYNDLLRNYINEIMDEIDKAIYIQTLQNRLTEEIGPRRDQTGPRREELQHLIGTRNQIARLFETGQEDRMSESDTAVPKIADIEDQK